MSSFLLPRMEGLTPYVPGEQPRERSYIKLNTNENPYPPSPKVLEALGREQLLRLNLYPDPSAMALRESIAAAHGLQRENIFVGNGSDEVLGLAFLAYADEEHPVTMPTISYGFYPVHARLFGAMPLKIPLRSDFRIPVESFCHAGTMIALANPNAPTGLALSLEELERILSTNAENVVLVDEAYVDFGGASALPLLSRYENLLIVRTFSKSRSLAGGRLGYAMAGNAIIQDLERMKGSFHPYSINSLTMAAGIAAMEDTDYFTQCVGRICAQREETAGALRELGLSVIPSQTNFLLVSAVVMDGETYYQKLRKRGILVRYLPEVGLESYVRITIGRAEQMAALFKATKEILQEETP